MSEKQKCPVCNSTIPSDRADGLCAKCLIQGALHPDANRELLLPDRDQLKELFPEWEILDCLGQGGMGTVYRVRQEGLDRKAALKITADDPIFSNFNAPRPIEEGHTLGKLTHRNIVYVFDGGSREGIYFILMEYADRGSLREAIRRGDTTTDETLEIVRQVCEALRYAHQANIVHRDIKPDNILLFGDGSVKVADFGLAKTGQSTSGEDSMLRVVGTQHYMAPEQLDSPDSVDHRADIYSLGVVMYELLTGKRPIGDFAPPSQQGVNGISSALDAVVLRMLERDPNDRYQTTAELAADLARIKDSYDEAQVTGITNAVENKQSLHSIRTTWQEKFTSRLSYFRESIFLWAACLTIGWIACEVLLPSLLDQLFAQGDRELAMGLTMSRATAARLIMAGVVISVFIYYLWSLRQPLMPPLKEKDFFEPTAEGVQQFCNRLRGAIVRLDRESEWCPDLYTPLEAEVEVHVDGKTTRRVDDLHAAIRSERRRSLFLMIGDPGSGKSVALRKLAITLLSEVDKTSRLPLYIDLKEWRASMADNPPSAEDLHRFILDYLARTVDDDFVSRHLNSLMADGRCIFLFDSFDEIPAVLDVDESDKLVSDLSTAILTFLENAGQIPAVVASRVYRRPNFHRASRHLVNLRVRPFDEYRIKRALTLSPDSEYIVHALFKERADLIPRARNPLTAGLIRAYIERHGCLPQHHHQLYDEHVRHRLHLWRKRILEEGLTLDEVVSGATTIAWVMFDADLGLRAPVSSLVSALEQELTDRQIRTIVAILRDAKLARLGSEGDEEFSFIHRRFHEYFVALKLISDPNLVDLSCIPRDSRQREALVLVCEVTDVERARKFAAYCWETIVESVNGRYDADEGEFHDDQPKVGSANWFKAVHALRFLADAFTVRRDCVVEFEDELAAFIKRRIDQGKVLSTKLSIEAAGVLGDDRLAEITTAAFDCNNSWIDETVMRACRRLARLDAETNFKLKYRLNEIPSEDFLTRYPSLDFAFSLSDAFRDLREFCRWRVFSLRSFFVAAGLFFLLTPVVAIAALLSSYVVSAVRRALRCFVPSDTDDGGLPLWLPSLDAFGFLAKIAVVILAAIPIVDHLFLSVDSAEFVKSHQDLAADEAQRAFETLCSIRAAIHGCLRFLVPATPILASCGSFAFGIPPAGLLIFVCLVIFLGFTSISAWLLVIEQWRLRINHVVERVPKQVKYVRENPIAVVCFIAAVIAMLGVFAAVDRIDDKVPEEVGGCLAIIFWCILAIVFAPVACSKLKSFVEDRRLLRRAMSESHPTREQIEEAFKQLHFSWTRLQYVRWLQGSHFEPKGEWDLDLPDFHDTASIELAILEEKWRRLDRY